jgi:hypothetical protein
MHNNLCTVNLVCTYIRKLQRNQVQCRAEIEMKIERRQDGQEAQEAQNKNPIVFYKKLREQLWSIIPVCFNC